MHAEQPLGVQVIVIGFEGQGILADVAGKEFLRQRRPVVGPTLLTSDDREVAVETLGAQRPGR